MAGRHFSVRWLRLTPDRIIFGLLAGECLLWLAESLHWFAKGLAAVTALAAAGAAIFLMLAWFVACALTRRRFQFSIRSLLALVLVVAVPISWMANELKLARAQAAIVKRLAEHSGYVAYDCQSHGEIIFEPERPFGPSWLRNLTGRDFFDEVEYLDFGHRQVGDVALVDLERLSSLEWLDISGSREMYRNHVRTELTDAGLEHIKALPKLKYLFLPGSRITDAGLGCLVSLPKLQSLDIENTTITDHGIAIFKRMPQLEELDLGGTKITDAGLEDLGQMRQLRELDLRETTITDRGLMQLERLSNLTELQLSDTQVTEEGVLALRQKLPTCKIGK